MTVLIACSEFLLVINMLFRCQLDVQPLGMLREKYFFKVSSEFLFFEGLEDFNLLFLSVEHIFMSSNFAPESSVFFAQVVIFLRYSDHDSVYLNLEFLISKCFKLGDHRLEEFV
jgi:hypothetical protein